MPFGSGSCGAPLIASFGNGNSNGLSPCVTTGLPSPGRHVRPPQSVLWSCGTATSESRAIGVVPNKLKMNKWDIGVSQRGGVRRSSSRDACDGCLEVTPLFRTLVQPPCTPPRGRWHRRDHHTKRPTLYRRHRNLACALHPARGRGQGDRRLQTRCRSMSRRP